MSAQECSPLQSQFPEVSEEEIERRLAYVQTIIEELTSNAITAPTPIISVEDDQPAHPFSGVTIYPDGSRVPLSPRRSRHAPPNQRLAQ